MNREAILRFIERQLDLETRIVELVRKTTSPLDNFFVKDILLGVAQDSQKHAALLGALKALLEGRAPLISEEQRDSVAEGIKEHITLEQQAIRTYSELIAGSEDSRVKAVAGMIRDDEIRHHRLLLHIRDTIINRETLDDEEVWYTWWRGESP